MRNLLAITLLFCSGMLAAFTPPFEDVTISRQGNNVSIHYGKETRRSANGAIFPAEYADLVTLRAENGTLTIDTRALFQKSPKGTIRINFSGIDAGKLVKQPGNRTNRLSWYLKSDRAGVPLELFFEGTQLDKEGKRVHFWKSQHAVSNGEEQIVIFDQVLPPSIGNLGARIQITGSGVFVIEKILCEPVEVETESRLDPKRNYLWNGGAERGFYGILLNSPEFALPEGAPQGWEHRLSIDRNVKYSGKASFRFGKQGGNERVYFNPVPFEFGQIAHFSAYLRADSPCKAVMALFVGNGSAYEKEIEIGEQWRKYELFIPKWDEQAEGVRKIGGMGPSSWAGACRHAFPHFTIPNGVTVWADNLSYHAGARGEYTLERGIAASGKLDRDSHCYQPGATVNAALELSNLEPTPGNAAVSWILTDFAGHELAKGSGPPAEVPANGEIKVNCPVSLPANTVGPLSLRFSVNGESLGFYLGALPPENKVLDRRIGFNYDRGNHKRAAEMLARFRIGAIRHWSNDDQKPWAGFEGVDAFHRAGFYNLMCLATQPDLRAESQVPYDLAPWAAEVRALAEKYRGKIDCYEILNEPNIWPGLRKNPDPAKFRDMTPELDARCIAVLGAAARQGDPAVKIAGPGTCGTSAGWPVSVLAAGAEKHLDLISEHPYRELPELPDYEPELNALKTAVRKFNPGFPVIATESGFSGMAGFPDEGEIPDFAQRQANNSVRLMLIGLGNGLDQFYLFAFSFRIQGTGWMTALMGGPDNGFHPLPSPVLFAVRGMIDRIYGAKPVRRIPLGNDYRCYLFDRGDVRVAALWKWNGEPVTVAPGTAWKNGRLFDLFGNILNPEKFQLSASPCYFETTLSADALAGQIAALPLRSENPLDFTLRAVDHSRFEILVRNLTAKGMTGALTAGGQRVNFRDLPPEQSQSFAFSAPEPIGLIPRTIEAETEIPALGRRFRKRFELKGIFPPESKSPLTIDGDASDWPTDAATLPLAVKTRLKPWDKAEEMLDASAKIAWDRDFLYVLVSVNKPDYRETAETIPAILYQSDSVQIAFDTLRNALPDTQGYQDDDFEYSVGRQDGRPVVYRHYASASAHDSFEKPLGVAVDVKAAIAVKNGVTTYEMAFPRRAISPFRLEPGAAMRINILLNAGNEKGRAGYVELTPGIGSTPKRPGLFMDLIIPGEKK